MPSIPPCFSPLIAPWLLWLLSITSALNVCVHPQSSRSKIQHHNRSSVALYSNALDSDCDCGLPWNEIMFVLIPFTSDLQRSVNASWTPYVCYDRSYLHVTRCVVTIHFTTQEHHMTSVTLQHVANAKLSSQMTKINIIKQDVSILLTLIINWLLITCWPSIVLCWESVMRYCSWGVESHFWSCQSHMWTTDRYIHKVLEFRCTTGLR